MAWGVTYMVKGFEVAYQINDRCENIEDEADVWFDEVFTWLTSFANDGLKSEAPLYYFAPIVN